MSKFKVRIKLQGLELDVEGSREDMPAIAQSVGAQFAGIVAPALALADAQSTPDSPQSKTRPVVEEAAAPTSRSSRPSSKRKPRAAPAARTNSEAVELRHDSSAWGVPAQAWNTAKKAIWLLYVVKKQAEVDEISASEIATLFNQHFKQAGTIQGNNVSRDLGKLKVKAPAPVGEQTARKPTLWFLTDEGIRQAEALVAQGLGKEQR